MKTLVIKNDHINKNKKQEYGCECFNCKSVFIFDDTDITRTRDLYSTPYVKCPNKDCNAQILLSNTCVQKFKNDSDKYEFELKHDE